MAESILNFLIKALGIYIDQWQLSLILMGLILLIIGLFKRTFGSTFKYFTKSMVYVFLAYIVTVTILAFFVFDSSAQKIFIHLVFPISFTLFFIFVATLSVLLLVGMAFTAIRRAF